MNDFTQENLERGMGFVYRASPDDISCDEAALVLVRLAEQAQANSASEPLSFELVKTQEPTLWQHILTCAECMGEFQLLLDLFNIVAADEMPTELTIPAPPDSPSLVERIGAALEKALSFPGFPSLTLAPTRGQQLNLGPVTLELGGGLSLEISPAINGEDESKRDLFVTLLAEEDAGEAYEGERIALFYAGTETTKAEGVIDEMGDAVLAALEPDIAYDLQFQLIRIANISIP